MGRGKIPIRRIENKTTRQVTFAKRRAGLFKKTNELSVLCDAQIALIVFSNSGKLFQYTSETCSMEQIINRYLNTTGSQIPPPTSDQEHVIAEMTRMRRETHNLQLSLQHYTANDLSSARIDDLNDLEHQVEYSLNKVRARKYEVLQQQMDNLRKKEKMLQEENEQIFQMIKNQQNSDHQLPLVSAPKPEESRNIFDQFPFSGEEQPSSVLSLASQLPPMFHPYNLQLPNLQDFSLRPSTSSDHHHHHHQ